MGPAILIGGGVILALIIALSSKDSEAVEAPPQIPPIPPPPGPIPPGVPIDEYPDLMPTPPQPPAGMPPGPPPEDIPPPALQPPGPVMITPSGPIRLTSPFKQIPSENWSKFVKRMARAQEGTITKGARYGMFLFGVRRLADLGLVKNVKRGTYRGQTVWTGTWIPPYSETTFLTSSKTQYRAFIKSMLQYAKKYAVSRKQKPQLFLLGTTPLTMSGFLGFAHLVGYMGAINSLKSRKIRPDTLAFVKKVNGLF